MCIGTLKKIVELIYTRHAIERMKKRRITRAEVEQTINDPETTYPSKGFGGQEKNLVSEKSIGNRVLKVVSAPAGKKSRLIITAVWKGEE